MNYRAIPPNGLHAAFVFTEEEHTVKPDSRASRKLSNTHPRVAMTFRITAGTDDNSSG